MFTKERYFYLLKALFPDTFLRLLSNQILYTLISNSGINTLMSLADFILIFMK